MTTYNHLKPKSRNEINEAFAAAGKKDRIYPIYSFSARWSQDGAHDPAYPNHNKDLPEGRIWDSTSFRKMYRDEKTQDELDAIMKEWWEQFLKYRNEEIENANGTTSVKHSILNPEIDYLRVELKKFDTWNLTWFQHETFDEGQTDEEALRSFEEYVTRVEHNNERIERAYPESERYDHGHECLMGAEDRWRWVGAGPNGERDESSPPPCRCKFCKEQGVLRIGH